MKMFEELLRYWLWSLLNFHLKNCATGWLELMDACLNSWIYLFHEKVSGTSKWIPWCLNYEMRQMFFFWLFWTFSSGTQMSADLLWCEFWQWVYATKFHMHTRIDFHFLDLHIHPTQMITSRQFPRAREHEQVIRESIHFVCKTRIAEYVVSGCLWPTQLLPVRIDN